MPTKKYKFNESNLAINQLLSLTGETNEGFFFEKPISEHLAINSKMKVPHRRLYVQNTKKRLEHKFERFRYIRN